MSGDVGLSNRKHTLQWETTLKTSSFCRKIRSTKLHKTLCFRRWIFSFTEHCLMQRAIFSFIALRFKPRIEICFISPKESKVSSACIWFWNNEELDRKSFWIKRNILIENVHDYNARSKTCETWQLDYARYHCSWQQTRIHLSLGSIQEAPWRQKRRKKVRISKIEINLKNKMSQRVEWRNNSFTHITTIIENINTFIELLISNWIPHSSSTPF